MRCDVMPVSLVCEDTQDRFHCAQAALDVAEAMGLPQKRAWEVALAVAEWGSNVVRHGGGGVLEIRAVSAPRAALEVVARDQGPGIPNVDNAMKDGVSNGQQRTPDTPRNGLGTGLGAVGRLMDEVHVETRVGSGTTVTARKWVGP